MGATQKQKMSVKDIEKLQPIEFLDNKTPVVTPRNSLEGLKLLLETKVFRGEALEDAYNLLKKLEDELNQTSSSNQARLLMQGKTN